MANPNALSTPSTENVITMEPVSIELNLHPDGKNDITDLQATFKNRFAAAELKSLLLSLLSEHGVHGMIAFRVTCFGDLGMGSNEMVLIARGSRCFALQNKRSPEQILPTYGDVVIG
jgi:microcompartment protein CcmK/EutM